MIPDQATVHAVSQFTQQPVLQSAGAGSPVTPTLFQADALNGLSHSLFCAR